MTRINTNVASLLGQRVLGQNNQALNTSLERLSTGLRINRGKDDPSGLIASENLRAEQTALTTAISNAERADQVVNIAEGGLNEVSSLLNELQSLVTQSANDAGLSREEKEANQLRLDSILQTIDRLASSTSFQGAKLLNGNFDYQVSSVNAQIDGFKVNAAKLEFEGTRDVDVLVTQSAQRGALSLDFGAGATALDLATADDQFVIEISGSLGSRELSFASGTALTDIVSVVNSFTDVTGVSASVSGGAQYIRLSSTEFGEDEFVGIKIIDDGGAAGTGVDTYADGDANTTNGAASAWNGSALSNGITDFGQDVGVTINGIEATTRGTTARINTDFLDVEVNLNYDEGAGVANAAVLGNVDAFTIAGGGADFQLAGRVDIAGKVSLGVGNVAAREIGKVTEDSTDYTLADLGSGKDLNMVDGDTSVAQKAIEQAIRDVSSLRGRLGAFQQNTVGATIRSLGVSLENTTAAESVIRDTDFASETASLTRSQILSQSATNILSIANSQPQNALALLG
jgi:flagellin